MNIFITLFLQLFLGFGLLNLIKYKNQFLQTISLSMLVGMVTSTFIVYLIGFFNLSLEWLVFIILLLIATILANWKFKESITEMKTLWKHRKENFKIYDLVFFGVFAYVFFISAWRAANIPITPYDAINGIDLFAKFAVKDKTMICSIFDTRLISYLSTQAYYAPFTSFMQMIYRMAGSDFGQFWLSILFFCFIVYAYYEIGKKVHPILVSIGLIFLVATPEFYAYTFLLQTDFSNAVFFGISVLLYISFIREKQINTLYLSSFFFGATCWSRSESIFFLPGLLVIMYISMRNKEKLFDLKALKLMSIYSIFPVTCFSLWNLIFFKFYFPNAPSATSELMIPNFSFSNLKAIFNEINSKVIFEDVYWAYAIYIFAGFLILYLALTKTKEATVILIWIANIYIVFFMLELTFSKFEIQLTVRRGFFKIIILIYFFMVYSHVFEILDQKIKNWERKKK